MLLPDFNELVALKNRKSDLRLSANTSVKSPLTGNHHSPFRGQGLEFDSVREYVMGDDIRNIDWRVTARKGTAHLKLFREERERNVVICVDMNETMRFGTRNTFKSVQAARAASLLGWRGLANHERVGACLFGDVPGGLQFFAPHLTRKSLWHMLKLLTESPSDHSKVLLDDILPQINRAVHTGSLLYVISDFLDLSDNLELVLGRFNKRCDIVFIAVNDPADKEIVPVGALTCLSKESGKILVNTESVKGRNAYQEQWRQNREKLHKITSRLKIATIELSTETDVYRDLLMGLRLLEKRRRR